MINNNYIELRKQIFELSPSEIGIEMDNNISAPYCVIMEFGINGNTVTLVSFIDGNASLYFSTGGAIIGGFSFPNVRNSASELINKSSEYLSEIEKCVEFPLAEDGRILFYILTLNGVYKIESDEELLKSPDNRFFKLFSAGQNLLTELRKIEEQRDS